MSGNKPSPFVAGEKSRRMQLIVWDHDLGDTPALLLLRKLGNRRPLLDVVSPTGAFGGRIRIAPDQTWVDYQFKNSDGTRAFVYGDWWRRVAVEEAAAVGMEAEVVERQLFIANEASRRDWIDGLVLANPMRLEDRWRRIWAEAPVLSDRQALALSGLYLRAHGDFTIELDQNVSTRISDSQLYRVGAAALVPDVARFLSGALGDSRSEREPAIFGLADAMVVRLGRALKARDYLHVRRRAPDSETARSDVHFFFESVLLSLQGALDAAARFLHVKYRLPKSRRSASWGRQDWRDKLARTDAPIGQLDGERLWNLDVLVGELRNSIHGEVMSQELLTTVGDEGEVGFLSYPGGGIALEAELAKAVEDAASAESDGPPWGIQSSFPDGVALIDPASYTEAAVYAVARALQSIAAAVASASYSELKVNRSFEELWTGSESYKVNARLLFGVGQLPPK